MTDFDRYAANYDATLSAALAVSGESKEYFARGRITYLKECLDRLNESVASVLDFGCGIGSGTRLLAEILNTLRLLRRYEPRLSRRPLGAQYQVLCEKPR